MAYNFFTPIDMHQNEVQNAKIQNLATFPGTPVTGQIVYKTTDNTMYYWNGTSWVSTAGLISAINGTAPIVVNTVSGTATVSITAATPSAAGSMSGADKTKLDAATSAATVSTIIMRNASGRAKVANGVAADDIATVGQITASATALWKNQGDIANAATNPNYPAASNGDVYIITTTAGRVGGASGKIVNIGDTLVAKADNAGGSEAAVGTSWIVVESNRDQATETVLGVAQIATQAETDAGTNDTDIVTPLKLNTYISNVTGVVRKTSATITGTGAVNSFTIPHTFATRDVQVMVYQSASPFAQVGVDINHTLTTSIDVVFGTNPAIGENYRVVILG